MYTDKKTNNVKKKIDCPSYLIFGQNSTLEEELKLAGLSGQIAVEIARSEHPEDRLVLVVSCLPLEHLFGGRIPTRFVGRTRRGVRRRQFLAKHGQ
jgi:hypothetical protein